MCAGLIRKINKVLKKGTFFIHFFYFNRKLTFLPSRFLILRVQNCQNKFFQISESSKNASEKSNDLIKKNCVFSNFLQAIKELNQTIQFMIKTFDFPSQKI